MRIFEGASHSPCSLDLYHSCHGNQPISHNRYGFIFRIIFFCISVVPMNYLVSTRNCHRDERTWVLVSGQYIFLLSNDFPVNFQVFINIHEYANKIIYI